MRRIFTKLFLFLILLCIVSAIGVSLLIANIDLNRVKPQIQQVVYNSSNIALAIDGSIDWVFNWQTMPSLSISVGKTRAYLDTPLDQLETIDINNKHSFGDIDAFTFGITLTELLKGQVNADELTISGLTLRLNKDKQGKPNWEAIGAKPSSANTAADEALKNQSEPSDKSSLFTLNALIMDRVQLDNIHVSYIDQQNGRAQNIIIESLNGKHVNLQGNAFPIKTKLTASTNGNQASTIALDLSSNIALSGFLTDQKDFPSSSDNDTYKNNGRQISVSDIDANIKISQQESTSLQAPIDTQAITIEGNASYRLNENAFVIDNMIIASDHSKIALTLNAIPIASSSKSQTNDLDINGKLNLKISNIQKQLNALGQSAIATSDSDALKTLSLNADIAGQITNEKQTFSLANVNATLDDSKIDGTLNVLLREKQKPLLSSKLNIDAINLDRYLANTAASSEAENPIKNSSASTNIDDGIDLSFLDAANIFATLSINQLTLNQLDFSNLNTEIDINNGELKRADFKGQFYSADISANATLKRNNRSEPLLSVKQSVKGLDVAALIEASLKESDKSKVLSGTADTESNLTMKGDSAQDWLRSLSGTTEIKLSDGIYHSDNIEHRICQAVALARNERLKTNWPSETALQNVSANINWQNGLGQLTTFKGGLSNVILDGEGSIDLINSRYSVALDAIITGAAPEQENTTPTDSATPSSEQTSQPSDQAAEDQTPQLNNSDPACIINARYRDIAWPILCEGSLADTEGEQSGCAVNRAKVNALIKTAIKEKAREKAKAAIEKKIDKELGDKLDEGIKDLIKGGLEGLFK